MAANPATTLPVHRLELDAYNQIVASGALDGQRVELLEGVVVDMSPQSLAHAVVIERLTRHFAHARARLRVQLPIEVPPDSEPEPDLALVEGPLATQHHPLTALLVVEVAVNSHAIDRGLKTELYARAGIPSYWLVDVPGRTVEVRSEPGGDGYARCHIHNEGTLVPCRLEGVNDLDVAGLLADVRA